MVNELVSKFSFIGDLKPQQTFNENLNKSIGLMGAMVGAIGALGVGLFAFTSSTLDPIDQLNDFSNEIGVNIEAIQELGFAAQMNGSSMEAMQSSLSGISKSIGDASRDLGRGKQAYEDLGISLKDGNGNLKTADVMFTELGEKMQKLNYTQEQMKSIAGNLGIDSSLLQLLKTSGKEIDDFRLKARALGIVTGEDAEKAGDFNDALDTLKYAMGAISNFVAIGLAPAFTDIISKMVDWLSASRDLITNGLQYMSRVIVSLSEAVVRLSPIIVAIGLAFLAWKIQAIGLRAVLATIFSPITLIIAAVVAVALVIDDLIVAFQGGESVINDFTKAWLGIDIGDVMRNMVDSVISAIDNIVETFSSMFSWLSNAWNSFSISNVMDGMVNSVFNAIDNIKKYFSEMFAWLTNAWDKSKIKSTLDWIGGGVSKGIESVKGAVSSVDMGAVSNFMMNPLPFPKAEPSTVLNNNINNTSIMQPPLFPTAQPAPISNNNVNQNVNITVASSDPIRAGQAVSDSLQGQMQDANKQFNRGGM